MHNKYIWLAASAVSKVVYGIALYKLIATTFGIDKLGLIGQLLSMLSISMVLSNGGIGRGIIQAYSRQENDAELKLSMLHATRRINLVASSALGIMLLLLCKPVAGVILGNKSLYYIVVLFAGSQFAMGINTSITSLLIAKDQSLLASKANLITVVIMALLVIVCTAFVESFSIVLVVLTLQPLILLILLRFVAGDTIYELLGARHGEIVNEMTEYLLKFSLAIILPVLFIQLNLIVSRLLINEAFGLQQLGLWEALIKIDEGLLQVIALPLIYFFLPIVSKHGSGHNRIWIKFVLGTMAIYFCGLLVFSVFGEIILALLFNSEAGVMKNQLLLLMGAGMVKTVFVINQYVLLAYNRVIKFILMELLFYSMYLASAWLGVIRQDINSIFFHYLISAGLIAVISMLAVKPKPVVL